MPLSDAARALVATHPRLLPIVLAGGDDCEIIFAASPEVDIAVGELSRASGVPITLIGRMVAPPAGGESEVSVRSADGHRMAIETEGWTHF